MTTAVANRPETVLPNLPIQAFFPSISKALGDAIWLVNGDQPPGPGPQAEARSLLAAHAGMLGAAKPAQVRNWLERVNLATSQPILPADFDVRAPAIIEALLTLPAAVFTVETANAFSVQNKWFPGAADVAAFLADRVREVHRFDHAIRKVANHDGGGGTHSRPPPTDEERAAVADAMTQIKALRSDNVAPRDVVKPAHLSREALLAAYRNASITGPNAP